MSINSQKSPKQDRRGYGRSVVKPHAGIHTVGTRTTMEDPTNPDTFSGLAPGAGNAPGSSGPPTTGPNCSEQD